MGRSVSTPSTAAVVAYTHFDDEIEDFNFEVIEPFVDHLRELFPSVVADDRWFGREDHIVASNGLAYFGISEYCGLVAYWIAPKGENPGVEDAWIARAEPKFMHTFGQLERIGTASNGESFYRRIAA